MDNSRLGYDEDVDPKEYFGEYYEDWLKAKQEVLYVFEDIIIEKPNLKDFRHIYKCFLNDEGLNYDDLSSHENLHTLHKIRDHAAWFFKSDTEDQIFMIYKNNEYAGFATLSKEGKYPVPTVTEVKIRKKFAYGLPTTCIIDYLMNFKYPKLPLTFENPNHPSGAFTKTVTKVSALGLTYSALGPDVSKRVAKILQRRINRKNRQKDKA